jgi:hypothetical protein
MRTRWLIATFVGLALLAGQVVPLVTGHVTPVFAKDSSKSEGKGRGDGVGGGFHEGGFILQDHGKDPHEGKDTGSH